ncbi:MAG: phosphate-starvation-inducible PsiE family protein [Ectothiorhodospiraceae bacterium]|nr:phosphate-starvation-inducible PsiE family protein [Ectothiorhodospiraceae bacterium]
MTTKTHKIGRRLLKLIEYGGLVIITIATLIAGTQEIMTMVAAGRVTLADLLLLFIYLEVVAMVAVYLESGKLPVRMPLYIAIVALARYLALDIKNIESWEIIAVSSAILILTVSVFMIRFGKYRYPYPEGDHELDRGPARKPVRENSDHSIK